MSLLTAAAVEIGKAVAKSIFKFWMKDSKLGQDISSSLIDLVGVKTSDTLAQRKGNRQFEDIGDKISESILPLLKSENIHLDEGERRAVAIAIAETLNKSKLSAELLLEQHLQPAQPEQYLIGINPDIMNDFSEAATFL